MAKFTPQKMTRWYDPPALSKLGLSVWLSSVFGSYADKRETQAALHQSKSVASFVYPKGAASANPDGFWFDYAADTGDGFNSTFTVAKALADRKISIDGKALPRGEFLVLGGDEVYPDATKTNYENRFSGPFELASLMAQGKNYPNDKPDTNADLFAIPGNHDWYDGLSSFLKLFCQQRSIGQWQSVQERSYFSIQLPHGWYLWAIDIQLESDIDKPQLDYFEEIYESMPAGSKVLLCTAEPVWLRPETVGSKNLTYFCKRFFNSDERVAKGKVDRKINLQATLAGDLHHYARYTYEKEASDLSVDEPQHRITSGGGGAFLHPTHHLPDILPSSQTKPLLLKKTYPGKPESARLSGNALLFAFNNVTFSVVMGVLFCLFAWFLQTAFQTNDETFLSALVDLETPCCALELIFTTFYRTPIAVIPAVILLVAMAFIGTMEGRISKWKSVFIAIHTVSQLLLTFLVFWSGAKFLNQFNLNEFWLHAIFTVWVFLGGGLLSGSLMGFWLYSSHRFISFYYKKKAGANPTTYSGYYDNEAFSSFRYTGYKNFLRLRVTKDGIDVYAIGIRKANDWGVKEGKELEAAPKNQTIPMEIIDEFRIENPK